MTDDLCVIVPTIRVYECVREYVANARRHGFDTDRLHFVLVTEDFCDTDAMDEMLDELDVTGEVFDGSARERWFAEQGIEEHDHLIPEASHAQTSFGLLYLWAGEFEYGVFIDDDTLPHEDSDFFGTHMDNLQYRGAIEAVESDERWVNVLYQTDTDLYPRGYPYSAMDETVRTETTTVSEVVASQGLWTNVPDLDAVRILMDGDLDGQAQTRLDADDYGEDFVAAPGQYLTVCSMNLAFRREVVPAFYQLPMDDNPWDVGRFDDIWSGVFLKRAADLLGKQIYNGAPLCEHNKAPRSTFGDLANEVAGLELNEHVWELTDRVAEAESFADAFERMAEELVTAETTDYENGEFLRHVGEYMHDWLDCLATIESDGLEATRSARSLADD
ncbi:Reversibly glycosylated polypeptide (RGP) familyprotein [Halapricum desulfuricans]|uniref:Reversibly glycosylated polypeptide (RGP) familyprotein n=1 Tax=Halapricum desulfuricans TaxID=2841257 RepID=A0A897NHC8_9EURY|nr:alpha-1 4-glucan-protein synthase [Halapricum desulfuricans]QSG11998.1 Reversibly glycosylated polypeptide (RGP) familyprotein [Halapricum desulfuricans]